MGSRRTFARTCPSGTGWKAQSPQSAKEARPREPVSTAVSVCTSSAHPSQTRASEVPQPLPAGLGRPLLSSPELSHKDQSVQLGLRLPTAVHGTHSVLYYLKITLCKDSLLTSVKMYPEKYPESHAWCF